MAMNPMQKKARTSFLLGTLLTLIITGIIIAFLILQLVKIRKEQAAIQYKNVYVVSQSITSGGNIQGSVTTERRDVKTLPSNAVTVDNAAPYITELATAKIGLEIGSVLTIDMVNTEGKDDTPDVRLQEYNMIVLPSKLRSKDTVDIRLRLPSGEDYIVLSKKYIESTSADSIWIKVGEDEILTMSNAIVEAYIMEGALLYATTYTDAGIQGSSIPTYVVSNSVITLMNNDPNIAATAKAALAGRYTEAARAQRDVVNQAKNNYAEDAISNIEDNLEQEIQKQQSARQQFIDSLGIR